MIGFLKIVRIREGEWEGNTQVFDENFTWENKRKLQTETVIRPWCVPS
jgi:hypothetical protein